MKSIYLLLCSVPAHSDKIIKNINIPVCKNCIYYKNTFLSSPAFSKCSKFGTKDIISGEISYSFVDSCRNDETRCGNEGKYFKKYSNTFAKVKQSIIDNMPMGLSIILGIALGLLL